jgi:uncharacterized protein YmfQ (DUF2313 family)
MAFGGYHPYPRRFGGGKPTLQTFHESLNAQRGTALDAANSSTTVWLEDLALMRAVVFDGWQTNQRLAHQWDPRRMTDMLERWEQLLKLRPPANTSDKDRRDVILDRFERFAGVANHAKLIKYLEAAVGEVFVGVEYISAANAKVTVPDGTYPWGSVVAGAPWSSTVAHILVLLQTPAGYTEAQFYEAAARVGPIVDAVAPAWAAFDWYRAPLSTPIIVIGGPSRAGFYLDDEHNLDNNVLDV